jgi:hypothetical protein
MVLVDATEGFARHRSLIAVCVVGAVVEAAVLLAIVPSAEPLASQGLAVPPLGFFHDLRWLFVYHESWVGFWFGLGALLLLRAGATTVMVRLAWPDDRRVPSARVTFVSSLAFTALAAVLFSPSASLLVGIAVVPFSWPYIAAVPAMLLIALLLSDGGLVSTWWRAMPPLRALAWMAASFLVLSAAALVTTSLPRIAGLPVAGLTGLFNAWAWNGLTSTMAHRPSRLRWPLPVKPVTAAAVLLAIVAVARLSFTLAARPPLIGQPTGSANGALRPVLVVGGFGSSCCLQALGLQRHSPDLLVQQFSYRGLDQAGQPLTHGSAAGDVALPVLGDRIDAQVAQLHQRTGQAVSIVAESEGTLATYAYLARHPGGPLAAIVLLSPIVDPGQATYPAAGHEGRGVAAVWELRTIVKAVGGLSPFGSASIDDLLQSTGEEGARYAASARCAVGYPRLTVVPLADAVTLPIKLARSVLIVPAFHGGLLGRADVQQRIHAFLDGERVRTPRSWQALAAVVSGGASAWKAPDLLAPTRGCGNG